VRDIPTIVAAFLHDTVEDTGTRPEEIAARFGEEVLSLVIEVSDDKSLPKADRKRLQIEAASGKSSKAKHIKLADKICNVKDVTTSPPHSWSVERRGDYLDWTERVVAGLRGVNRELEACYDEALSEGKSRLEDEAQKKQYS
jgi:(p)ppGpp synthase/HD superfamily hydrolase